MIVTAPGIAAVQCASTSNSSSDLPASHQNGAPAPTVSNNNASAIRGIEASVVKGIAMTLASAPYTPARWKWNRPIGISASSITTPVSSSIANCRDQRAHSGSSRGALKARIGAALCNETIAMTEAKLI